MFFSKFYANFLIYFTKFLTNLKLYANFFQQFQNFVPLFGAFSIFIPTFFHFFHFFFPDDFFCQLFIHIFASNSLPMRLGVNFVAQFARKMGSARAE